MSRPKTNARFSSAADSSRSRALSRSTSVSPSDPDAELIGAVIDGRYQISELIGRGGMGSVYKAEHLGIRRLVALKLLHPSLAQLPEVSRRFEREAFAIGRIEHPNCVNVSDFGQLEDGSLYLVMEYLEGRSLGDELAEQTRLDPRRAMRILRHVLRGLGHAHDNDIVHRDVKPENVVLVHHEGDPDFAKLLDFGIAKLIGDAAEDDGDAKLTQAGMAFGTPIYMSPEQAVGNPIDGRADLYAASVMAYEMITGKPPFHSDDKLEVMSMHTSRPVPPFCEMAPDVAVPQGFEAVIVRGLAKRSRERYATAAEFIAAIDAVLGETPLAMPAAGLHTSGMSLLLPDGSTITSGSMAALHATPHATQGVMTSAPAAQASRRRLLIGLGCAAAVSLFLLILGVSQGTDGSMAGRAAEQIERGDPRAAIKLLESDKDAISEDAAAQLQLGHAYALARDDDQALDAYRQALQLDPKLGEDGKLRANLSVLRDSEQGEIALSAIELLVEYLDDDAARNRLVDMASGHKDQELRHRAVAAAQRLELDKRVDWVESYLLDLVQFNTCAARSEIVPKLRELGDKRAIKPLKTAASRRGRYGSTRNKPINRCLRQEALDAAAYLESLPAPDEAAESPTGPT